MTGNRCYGVLAMAVAWLPTAALAASLNPSLPSRLARETITPGMVLSLGEHGGHAWDMVAKLDYALSFNETRNVRIDCRNIAFDAAHLVLAYSNGSVAAPTVVDNGPGGARASLLFSISALAGGSANDTVTVHPAAAGGISLRALADAECSYALYQGPADALAGGSAGMILTTGMQPYLQVASAVTMDVQPGVLVTAFSGPSPGPAFSQFKSARAPALLPQTWKAVPARVTFGTSGDLYRLDGQPVTVDQIYAAGSRLMLYGDIGTGPGFEVRLGTDPLCDPAYATMDAAMRAFPLSAPLKAGSYHLCYWVSGNAAIPDAEWQLMLVAANGVASRLFPAGSIHRDGVELQATIASFDGHYVNRLVVANDGPAVPYRLRILNESGDAISTESSLMSGMLAGRRSTTIDLSRLLAGGAEARVTLFMAIDTSRSSSRAVKAMIQTTHKASGAVANSQLVRVELSGLAF